MTKIAPRDWAALANKLIQEIKALKPVGLREKRELSKFLGRLQKSRCRSKESREGALLALQLEAKKHADLLEACKSREDNQVALLGLLALFNRVMEGVPAMLGISDEEAEALPVRDEIPSTSAEVLSV